MIYKFVVISSEVDDFMREISINSDAKFIELHDAILDSVNYTKDAITSFFICDDDWGKGQEITLIEMDTASDVDSYVMDTTTLDELIDDEGQKLLYVFDYISDRCFFIQLKEIVTGQELKKAKCTASIGEAPEQYQFDEIEDMKKGNSSKKGARTDDDFLDETFYGEDGFNEDEFDNESFSDFNFDDEPLI